MFIISMCDVSNKSSLLAVVLFYHSTDNAITPFLLRIRWPGGLLILKKNSDGCLKKFVVMLRLFWTVWQQMFQRYICSLSQLFINHMGCSLSYAWPIDQAIVLCQVEKAKEDMLNQLYSSIRLYAYSLFWNKFVSWSCVQLSISLVSCFFYSIH